MMGVIAGSVTPDAGTVSIAGELLDSRGTLHAQELGVAMVSQEFPLVGQLSVAENLLLGRRPSEHRLLVDRRAMRRRRRGSCSTRSASTCRRAGASTRSRSPSAS